MKPGYNAKPGTELRGFQVRLYPTRDQVLWLEAQQHALRRVWNWLVGQSASCDEAVQSYAVKQGRVGPRPVRPEYAGMLPDEAASACAAHRDAVRDWYRAVREATKDDPVCARRTLRDWMTHFERIPLSATSALETNGEYYVRVRAHTRPRNTWFVWPWDRSGVFGHAKFTFIP